MTDSRRDWGLGEGPGGGGIWAVSVQAALNSESVGWGCREGVEVASLTWSRTESRAATEAGTSDQGRGQGPCQTLPLGHGVGTES